MKYNLHPFPLDFPAKLNISLSMLHSCIGAHYCLYFHLYLVTQHVPYELQGKLLAIEGRMTLQTTWTELTNIITMSRSLLDLLSRLNIDTHADCNFPITLSPQEKKKMKGLSSSSFPCPSQNPESFSCKVITPPLSTNMEVSTGGRSLKLYMTQPTAWKQIGRNDIQVPSDLSMTKP